MLIPRDHQCTSRTEKPVHEVAVAGVVRLAEENVQAHCEVCLYGMIRQCSDSVITVGAAGPSSAHDLGRQIESNVVLDRKPSGRFAVAAADLERRGGVQEAEKGSQECALVLQRLGTAATAGAEIGVRPEHRRNTTILLLYSHQESPGGPTRGLQTGRTKKGGKERILLWRSLSTSLPRTSISNRYCNCKSRTCSAP